MSIFKVGDKVRILSKTVPDFERSLERIEAIYPSLIGYVSRIEGNGDGSSFRNCIVVDKEAEHLIGGNYFAPKDLELFDNSLVKIWAKKRSQLLKSSNEMEKQKEKISIELVRKNGETFLQFEISPKIEELYNQPKAEIRESENWVGLKFYYIPEITQNQEYLNLLSNYRLIDDFGSGFIKNGYLNIAWLRTVGGKGKIKISGNVSFSELSILIKNTLSFIKEYFESYLRDFEIKGNLTIEI